MKLIQALWLIGVLLISGNSHAAIKTGMFYCDGCSNWKIKSLASRIAGNNDAQYTVYDRTNGYVHQVTVDTPTFNGSAEDEQQAVVVKVLINNSATTAFKTLLQLNADVQLKSQVEINLDSRWAFTNIFQVMQGHGAKEDFVRLLQNDFNSGKIATLQEIQRRAENQVQMLNSSLTAGFGFIGGELGNVIADSSWLVNFADGSTLVVDVSFKLVSDKVMVIITPNFTLAKDKNGNSIPMSKYTTNGVEYSNENANYIENLASYYQSLGLDIERHNQQAGWDNGKTCRSAGMSCTKDQCTIKYVCTD